MVTIMMAGMSDADLELMERLMNEEGFTVLTAQTSEAVISSLETHSPDLFLIDTQLSDISGIALCAQLRAQPEMSSTPVIFTSKQNAADIAADALNAGGDDYIRRPFAPRELVARIRAHLRRAQPGLELDRPQLIILPETHQVIVDGNKHQLTPVEFDLLVYMSQHPDRWYTTRDLLSSVWQYPDGVGDAALVRNHVHNLRCKIEPDPSRPVIIQSRHRRGYVVRAHVHWRQTSHQSS